MSKPRAKMITVKVFLTSEEVRALDRFRSEHPKEISRPASTRTLVIDALCSRGLLGEFTFKTLLPAKVWHKFNRGIPLDD
jgi:hypothetical protein